MKRTVLWAPRRGDVLYASRDYWRQTIPIGDDRVTVATPVYFDVGDVLDVSPRRWPGGTVRVTGKEGVELGVRAA